MLEILTNNSHLTIPSNIKMSFSEVNQMIVRGQGDNTLTFNLSKENKHRLGWPADPGIKRLAEFDSLVKTEGIQKNGILRIEDTNNGLNSQFIASTFYYRFGDKSIRKLSLGGSRNLTDYKYSPGDFQRTSDQSDFVLCKVRNTKFMADTAKADEYTTNNNYQNNSDYAEFYNPWCPITPFIYLCYLYEQLFKEHGYTISFNILRNDVHFKRLVLYNNQGAKDSSGHHITRLGYHLPKLTITEFINAISDALNIHPIIDENTKSVSIICQDFKFINPKIIDLNPYYAGDLTRINSEKLPTRLRFFIKPDSNDNRQYPAVEVDQEEDITILDSVASVELLPAGDPLNSVRLVTNLDSYYKHNYNSDGNLEWEEFSKNIQPKYIGTEGSDKSIEPALSFIQPNSYSYSGAGWVEMAGNSSLRQDKVEIPLMLAFASEYSAGLFTLTYQSNILSGGFSSGSNQLYLKPWSIYDYCWRRLGKILTESDQPYEATVRLPAFIHNNFDFTALYRIENNLFRCQELDYDLESDRIVWSKSKFRAF